MKKVFILLLSITLISSGVSFAQNNAGKADDEARISITPQVTDSEIPAAAKKNLINKMKQIATKNGLAGDGDNPFFIMDASVDVLSKEITPTAPPMHALSIQINFFIKDINGAVFSETSYTTKGVGKNETKAYLQGLKNINTSKGQFKAFVERGKEKIVEYYNSQCDFVISKAQTLHKQGRNDAAIKMLESVPPVCKECYDMCMEVMSEIMPSEEIDPNGPCELDTVISVFDINDEGWIIVGDAQESSAKPNYIDSLGNPGGYISADDNATGGTWYWSAPQKYLGNKSCFYGKVLSFSLKQSSISSQFDDADIILVSNEKKIVFNTLNNPEMTWTDYSVTLNAEAGWVDNLTDNKAVSKEYFIEILGNLTAIYIRGEFVEGEDTGGLDNVILLSK